MKYQYTSEGYTNKFFPPSFSSPNGVKFLLIVNLIIFLLVEISSYKSEVFIFFGLSPAIIWNKYKFWQLATYLFIHGGFFHIIFNMFVLWMFGKDLEREWGKKDFLVYYFICGIGAGLLSAIFNYNSYIPIVGASGAIYGLLVAYGFTYPDRLVYLYGLIPIKIKHMIIGLGLIAFFASLSASQSNVSHITHLSGMFIGLLMIYFNIRWSKVKLWYYSKQLKNLNMNNEKKSIQYNVDKILDKINTNGWDSITEEEQKYLNTASKTLFNNKSPN